MTFEFTDNRNWKYLFKVYEHDLMFINIQYFDETGAPIGSEEVAFFEDVFNWRPRHTRGAVPLLSKEAKDYCENHVKSYMKLKAFW